jgi:hypothetical protein
MNGAFNIANSIKAANGPSNSNGPPKAPSWNWNTPGNSSDVSNNPTLTIVPLIPHLKKQKRKHFKKNLLLLALQTATLQMLIAPQRKWLLETTLPVSQA